jgi:hypothetical protein
VHPLVFDHVSRLLLVISLHHPLLTSFVLKVCAAVMPRVHRKVKPKADRRAALSVFIEEFDRVDMPACSSCKKAGALCHISSAHPDCSRCVRLGTRCDASFDSEQGGSYGISSFLVSNLVTAKVLADRVKALRKKRDELRRQLAEVELSLSKDEATVREAVAREVQILNTWDASDFDNSSITVDVSPDLTVDFVGNSEDDWVNWLESSRGGNDRLTAGL